MVVVLTQDCTMCLLHDATRCTALCPYRADFKRHESPYRRGVVTAQDFQRIVHAHGAH
jgi:hypothetical protein